MRRFLLSLLFGCGLGVVLALHGQEGPRITSSLKADGTVEITWPALTQPFQLESSASLGSPTVWQPSSQSPVRFQGRLVLSVVPQSAQTFFRLRQSAPAGVFVTETSPAAGEGGVAVTRETVVRFSEPLADGTILSAENFHALFGGRRILARAELSSDRRTATLFYLENLPASATIKVRLDGTGLRDTKGVLLDTDGDGTPGGVFTVQFNTLGNTALDGTGVIGWVFASETGPGGTNLPLKGVTITVDGVEETLRTVTDAQGFFHLQNSPAGRFFVHIDGRTADASAWPNGAYYPTVGKAWNAAPGKSNNLAGGNGQIFLPFIPADALQPVSAVADTVVKFSSGVVSTNPAFANVAITVPANALFSDNGTRGGRVGLAPVPPNRLPERLPPGLEMPIVITVQTDGPLNFDRPAPVCFPNLPDPVLGTPLAPGTKQALVSFNHDKGQWEAVGTMTVSADGALICSDPGSGILQPGWHGTGPRPTRPKPKDDDDDDDDDCNVPDEEVLKACLDDARDLANKCRKSVSKTYERRRKHCYSEYPPNLDVFVDEARDRCIREAQDDYSRDNRRCDKREKKMIDECYECNAQWTGGLRPLRERAQAMATGAIDEEVDAKFDELLTLFSQDPPVAPDVLEAAVQGIMNDLNALTDGDVQTYLLNAIIRIERQYAASTLR